MIDQYTASKTLRITERREFIGPVNDREDLLDVLRGSWNILRSGWHDQDHFRIVAEHEVYPDLAAKWRAEADRIAMDHGLGETDRMFNKEEAKVLRRCAEELTG